MDWIDDQNVQPSIQVWRPSGSNFSRISQYQIVDHNIIEMTNYTLASVSFTGANRTEFQSGDVVGYYLPDSPRYTVWNIHTPGSISYAISADNPLSIFSTNNSNVEADRQPLIQVTFGETIIPCLIIMQLATYT